MVTVTGKTPPPKGGPAAQKKTKKVATKKPATTTKAAVKKASGGVEEELVDEQDHTFLPIGGEQTGEVEVSLGFLSKTADFENVRGHVSVRVPTDMANVDEAFAWAKNWCDDKLGEMHADVMEMVQE